MLIHVCGDERCSLTELIKSGRQILLKNPNKRELDARVLISAQISFGSRRVDNLRARAREIDVEKDEISQEYFLLRAAR